MKTAANLLKMNHVRIYCKILKFNIKDFTVKKYIKIFQCTYIYRVIETREDKVNFVWSITEHAVSASSCCHYQMHIEVVQFRFILA